MDRERILADYQAIRAERYRLQTELAKREIDHMFEVATALGVTEGKSILVDSENDVAYLMDHLIYDRLEGGRNLVHRLYEQERPPEGSTLRKVIEGMLGAHYGVLRIEERVPGLGIHVFDLVRHERLFVVDIGLSHTASTGEVMASRLLPHDGFHNLTGAAMPRLGAFLGIIEREVYSSFGRSLDQLGVLGPVEDAKLATLVVREAWKLGANQHFATTIPSSRSLGSPASSGQALRVGRNDPCPCGSGKKFKKCCGA